MGLLDLLFPKNCLECHKSGGYICGDCLSKVGKPQLPCVVCTKPSVDGLTHVRCKRPQSLDGMFAPWKYGGVVKKTVRQLKYHFSFDVAKELVERFAERNIFFPKNCILVPIPLHRRRKNWRGFNQSEVLGELIAKKKDWKYFPDLLVRRFYTKTQTGLGGEERRKNVKGAFGLGRSLLVDYKSPIVLFDDVWTTGSTMKEAGKVLKRRGFEKVYGLTLAK